MKFRNTKAIKADRLVLRSFTDKDYAALSALLVNEEIGKTFMLPDFKSEEEKTAMCQRFKALSESADRFVYGIYLSDELIGFINDVEITEDSVELGYVIHPDYKGNGYATEALRAAIDEIHASGFQLVRTGAFEENLASMRVMEKCGMTKEAYENQIKYKGIVHKCIYYSTKSKNPL